MNKKINLFFLTFFKIGNIKYAPGTIASFITCALFLILINFVSLSIIFLSTLIIFIYSFVAINSSYEEFNSEDPKEIVIDEVVGQMLTLIAIPVYETLYPTQKLYYCIFAFVLFRFFDIWKPLLVGYVDKNVKGALGIMLDDIIAGVFTIIILSTLFFYIGGKL
jgi:phosphatidylglycerophosphatase A